MKKNISVMRPAGKIRVHRILISLLCVINTFAQENSSSALENGQKVCASATFGLEFCSESSSKTFKLGEPVVLQFSLRNVTGEAMEVGSVPENAPPLLCCAPYEFTVLQEDDRPLPTILDELNKKSEDGTITQEERNEQFQRCCINRGSRWGNKVPLAAGKGYRFEVNLSMNYNFVSRGKYFITARRNVAVANKSEVQVIDLKKTTIFIE